MNARSWILTAALLASALPGPAALAGQEPPDTLPIVRDSLVVEVLRTPFRLGDVPYAAAVLGPREIQQAASGLSLEGALHGMPGVQIQNRYNYAVGERIAIRGFGARAQFGVRGLRVLVDGIPATLPDGQSTLDHVAPGMLRSVEALRGPAAALYGNASGGVLRFEGPRPAPGGLSTEWTAVGGSDGLGRLQGMARGTLGGTGYVFAAEGFTYDGYRANPVDTGPDPYGEADRIALNGGLVHRAFGGELAVRGSYVNLSALNPGSLSASLLAQGKDAFRFNVLAGTGKDVEQGQLGVSWQGPVAGLDAQLVAYGVRRLVDNPIPGTIIDLDRSAGGIRAQVAWQRGILGVVGGLDGDLQADDRKNHVNEGGAPAGLALDQDETVRSLGGFLQASLRPLDRLGVVGAIRYDGFAFEVDDAFIREGDPDDSGRRDFGAFSPGVGVHLTVTPSLSLFGNLARSFETPTTTELANRPEGSGGFNPDLDPQTATTLEAGLRFSPASRLATEVVVFRSRITDELVPFEVPGDPGRTYFRNAGTSTYRGLEVTAQAALVPGLRAGAAWSYTDARFDEYSVGDAAYDGNQVPGLAPHRVEITLEGWKRGWLLRLEGEYVDPVPADDANEAYAGAHRLANVRLGRAEPMTLGGIGMVPFLGVTNVTDERYVSSVVVNAFGSRYFEPGPGRGLYVGLTVRTGARR